MAKLDIAGQRFGRLVAVEFHSRKPSMTYWLCQCDCGKQKAIALNQLRSGKTRSCGCLAIEEKRKRATKHGEVRTPLHNLWRGMHARCKFSGCSSYRLYGGRGVSVCEEWATYEPFRDWAIANGYAQGLSIDRIDPDGDYQPANCRWVSKSEQQRNKRNTFHVEWRGERGCLREFTRKTGKNYSTVYRRIKNGWSVEDALTLPSGAKPCSEKPK